jgi:hypothetical protein
MTLKDYIKSLQKLAKDHPDAILISASDAEGNSYSEVSWKPSLMWYDRSNREVYNEDDLEDYRENHDNDLEDQLVRAICVN